MLFNINCRSLLTFIFRLWQSRWRNMKPKFWLSVAFLMSRIGVFQAAVQCQTAENSIGGMFLRGHSFKTSTVGWPGGCYLMCEEEVTCQSYNFVIGHKVCELNNRTKEARPEDFRPDQTRFYMKRAKNRGTLPFLWLACLSPFSPQQPFSMLASVTSVIWPAASNSPIGEAKPWLRRNGRWGLYANIPQA